MARMKPKLTLRDLFWLVLVVAMGGAWWWDRNELQTNAHREASKANNLHEEELNRLIQHYEHKVFRLSLERDEAVVNLKNLSQRPNQ
jgi:hypothetical protein